MYESSTGASNTQTSNSRFKFYFIQMSSASPKQVFFQKYLFVCVQGPRMKLRSADLADKHLYPSAGKGPGLLCKWRVLTQKAKHLLGGRTGDKPEAGVISLLGEALINKHKELSKGLWVPFPFSQGDTQQNAKALALDYFLWLKLFS